MARANVALATFNRGMVSRFGAARAEVKRLALGARNMTNWVARTLGAMGIRPGTGYLGSTRNDAACHLWPFIFALDDKAIVEITTGVLRVWIDDALVTRASVSTAITNGTFTTNLASWTDDDESGAVSQWVSPGYMELVGASTTSARRTQTVSVSAGDQAVEHALNIVIARGPVILRVGTTSGGDELISETSLDEGSHSLTFTPNAATIYIRFQSPLLRKVWVDSVAIASAGTMEVTAPWTAGDLDNLRSDQSGDIIFIACSGKQQYKIERRSTRSWSVVKYLTEDGPFRIGNVTPMTMTPSVSTGNGTLTASAAYFKSTNVGGLFSITHTGQRASVSASAENTFSSTEFVVTGTSTARAITIEISGTFVATLTVQRSTTSASGPWADTAYTYTAPTTVSVNDGLDNQEVWYRIGIKTGAYTSGTAVASISVGVGSTRGVCRITGFTSATVCDMEVLSQFAALTATDEWSEGLWSDRRGWPTAVALHEGRLWWAGKDKVVGSVSDAYYSYDSTVEGDSAPISRSIGSGPVDKIQWLMSLQRLLLGGQMAEFSARSSSLDEPLTVTNFNLRASSNQGSGAIEPVKIGATGIFVQRGGSRVYELAIDPQSYDYAANHLSAVCPEIGRPQIIRAAMQMQPEPRWHGVRSDGKVAILMFDRAEQVTCWSLFETDGVVEDVAVLPGDEGTDEDRVYYVVKRTIAGSTKRYLERFATETACHPDEDGVLTACELADSATVYSGAAVTEITTCTHLEGERVVIWADGADVGTAQDDSGTRWLTRGCRKPLALTGAAGTYASTPDSATISVTGDLDVRALVAMDDWTPAAATDLVSKWNATGNQRSWRVILQTDGTLSLSHSAAGTAAQDTDTSTAAPEMTDGDEIWLRVTLDADDGAGNHVVTFYTSYDYDGTSGTWDQLGDAITTAGTTTIFDSTAALEVGSRDGGTAGNLDGNVYCVQVFNGIAGTKVAEMNTIHAAAGTAPWVSSTTGETWTQNGAATIGALRVPLPAAASDVVVGLPYTAQWESNKLIQIPAQLGTALARHKTIPSIALILADTHAQGLRFGRDFDNLDDMPSVEEGATVDTDSIHVDYDGEAIAFPGTWSTDERLCLEARAPRPATVVAAVIEGAMNE